MDRKIIKRILLITGVVIATAGLIIFFLTMFSFFTDKPCVYNNLTGTIFPSVIIIIAGVIPLIIVSLMHSKDIRETKPGLSGLLKFLAYFWIINGALNAVALIMISIFFMK